MMTCRKLVELLMDYLDGTLPPEHHRLVEQHLHKCPPCVTYLETYRLTIQVTRQLPCKPLPPALCERLQAAMKDICKGRPAGDGTSSAGDPPTEIV